MNIVLGKSEGKNVALDVKVLLRTHLLIWASTGGGKSYLIRRLAEQAFGKLPIIIVDREGEFPTLREKHGFVLVGPRGETPADPRSAKLVAERLLEARASAVCDLFELGVEARHEWVKNFYSALINAPKSLWGPTIVILDEAHTFAPEKGQGESIAYASVTDFNGVARKRGFASILATQRLSKLSKNATAEMYNQAAGPTAQQSDRDRAAYEMGIPKGQDARDFSEMLRTLEPGHFFFQGRAVAMERVLVAVGPVETSHGTETTGKHAAKTPPTPEEVKAILPKLADLPKQAEEKAKTEAELRTEIRSLKAQLRAQPKPVISEAPRTNISEAQIRRALRDEVEPWRAFGMATRRELVRAVELLKEIGSKQLESAQKIGGHVGKIALPDYPTLTVATFDTAKAREQISAGEIKSKGTLERLTGAVEKPKVHPRPEIPYENNGDLSRPQLAILKAIAEFEAIGRQQISKSWIAARSGASATSSAFSNNLGYLRANGYISYPVPDTAALTEKGRGAAGDVEVPTSSEEMLESCLALLSGPQRKILQALYRVHPGAVDKQTLAEASGASATSSAFSNNLGALRSAGMIDYPEPGMAKASDWIFID